ncbi:MAG: T9SS type A sorting domain-containing protein [Ignavibacteriae bacterium]|nr:T9SS type A sorting domain-containing protein [Ignavibacteriota bacterium]
MVGLEQNEEIKYIYKLYQNYPNPFNPSTTIKFEIPQREDVKIILLNILGEEIDEIFKGELNSGIHEINYDGSSLSSGIYLYQIKTPNIIETRKCILLK